MKRKKVVPIREWEASNSEAAPSWQASNSEGYKFLRDEAKPLSPEREVVFKAKTKIQEIWNELERRENATSNRSLPTVSKKQN